jgi:hypothetical protein
MLRPRESRELRLISSNMTIAPAAAVTWAQDVFGNAVATATYQSMSDNISIDSVTELELESTAWPIFDIAATAIFFPFRYSDEEWTDLGALTIQQYPDPSGRLRDWACAFVRGNPTDTLSLLKDLSAGLSAWISYQSRDDEGTQAPTETLERGWGSCRDFAVLFVEAARCLGFGARIVFGYLYNPNQEMMGSSDAGSTHAWAEVYVPGAGWITCAHDSRPQLTTSNRAHIQRSLTKRLRPSRSPSDFKPSDLDVVPTVRDFRAANLNRRQQFDEDSLKPASASVPPAAAEKQNENYDDEKCLSVHDFILETRWL